MQNAMRVYGIYSILVKQKTNANVEKAKFILNSCL